MSIFGKGGKRKEVVISVSTWSAVKKLRLAETTPLDPVFTCKYDGGLRRMSETMFYRVVVKAAIRAGVRKKVSPHFLRHSHATHALNRGAGLKLLQETLGHSSLEQTGRYLHSDLEESSGKYLGV